MITEDQHISELTIEQFKAWLEARDKATIVGQSGYANVCPLACYLASCGYFEPEVWPGSIDIANLHLPTPDWAREFIERTDGENRYSYEVSAEDALDFLKWAEMGERMRGWAKRYRLEHGFE